jgi:hypothetical protein
LLSLDIKEFSKTPKEDNGLENSDKPELIESKEFCRNSPKLKPLPMMIDYPKIELSRCADGALFGKVISLSFLIFSNIK